MVVIVLKPLPLLSGQVFGPRRAPGGCFWVGCHGGGGVVVLEGGSSRRREVVLEGGSSQRRVVVEWGDVVDRRELTKHEGATWTAGEGFVRKTLENAKFRFYEILPFPPPGPKLLPTLNNHTWEYARTKFMTLDRLYRTFWAPLLSLSGLLGCCTL